MAVKLESNSGRNTSQHWKHIFGERPSIVQKTSYKTQAADLQYLFLFQACCLAFSATNADGRITGAPLGWYCYRFLSFAHPLRCCSERSLANHWCFVFPFPTLGSQNQRGNSMIKKLIHQYYFLERLSKKFSCNNTMYSQHSKVDGVRSHSEHRYLQYFSLLYPPPTKESFFLIVCSITLHTM